MNPNEDRAAEIDRRTFISGIAAASAATVLPRRVLGGPGFVAPSDRLNVAQIGCGTQGLRQASVGLARREDVQITCVCDPNADSTNYVDWSRDGLRDSIRRHLEDDSWGDADGGIRAGREVARRVIETYYGRTNRAGGYRGLRAYSDFRQLFDRESDLDAAVIITPDHTHAAISVAALRRGVAAIAHKPVSNVLHEVRVAVRAAEVSSAASHLLAYNDHRDYRTLSNLLDAGAIGAVQAVHNWTSRPFWPQGWLSHPTEQPPVPAGFDWDMWLGPEPYRPYHPTYTFALYRGWYDFGGGCFADMGNYSLWNVYRLLGLGPPTSVEGRANTVAFVDEHQVSRFRLSDVAYPVAGTIHFTHHTADGRPLDVFWYEGGMKPETPAELRSAGETLESEGMLFVGDAGKILCSFHGHNPRLLAEGTVRATDAFAPPDDAEVRNGEDEWVLAVQERRKSAGSFESVAPLAEATALAGVAYRLAGRRLDWDSQRMTVTNVPEANQYVERVFRPGWEM